jgi:hypothetical protein
MPRGKIVVENGAFPSSKMASSCAARRLTKLGPAR